MTIEEQIQATELKIVALRKAAITLDMELAAIKKKSLSKPVPSNNKKAARLQGFADYYMKKGIL